MKKFLLTALLLISPVTVAGDKSLIEDSEKSFQALLQFEQAAVAPPVKGNGPSRGISEKQFELLLGRFNKLDYKIDYLHEQLTRLENREALTVQILSPPHQ